MILTSKIEFKSRNGSEEDRQTEEHKEARNGLTLKNNEVFRKQEGREEEEKNKDGLTKEGVIQME